MGLLREGGRSFPCKMRDACAVAVFFAVTSLSTIIAGASLLKPKPDCIHLPALSKFNSTYYPRAPILLVQSMILQRLETCAGGGGGKSYNPIPFFEIIGDYPTHLSPEVQFGPPRVQNFWFGRSPLLNPMLLLVGSNQLFPLVHAPTSPLGGQVGALKVKSTLQHVSHNLENVDAPRGG